MPMAPQEAPERGALPVRVTVASKHRPRSANLTSPLANRANLSDEFDFRPDESIAKLTTHLARLYNEFHEIFAFVAGDSPLSSKTPDAGYQLPQEFQPL